MGQQLLDTETYSNLLTKLIIVLIYVLEDIIVVRNLNKVNVQVLKVKNRSGKTTRAKKSKTLIT
ncbi:mechanosensitive ion channel family protein, partial [Staphylococcus pseudintermedius]